MSKMSLLDKIKVLWEVSLSSPWFIVAIIILVALGFVFITTSKRTVKTNKKIYILFSLGMILLFLGIYHTPLDKLLNYLIDNIFVAILFPNLAIYFAGIIIMNIIVWISLFNFKTSETIKKINITIYVIMNYLLILILKVIDTSKLDIFSESTVYENSKATALVELSSLIFIVWVIFLILYKIILIYLRKDYKPKVRKVLVPKPVKKLPENYQPTTPPTLLAGNVGKRVTLIDTSPKYMTENFEKMLTVEDYKLLLKILKEEKTKDEKERLEKEALELEKQQLLRQRQIQIEREQQEELKKQEQLAEQEKYTELERLYRGML